MDGNFPPMSESRDDRLHHISAGPCHMPTRPMPEQFLSVPAATVALRQQRRAEVIWIWFRIATLVICLAALALVALASLITRQAGYLCNPQRYCGPNMSSVWIVIGAAGMGVVFALCMWFFRSPAKLGITAALALTSPAVGIAIVGIT